MGTHQSWSLGGAGRLGVTVGIVSMGMLAMSASLHGADNGGALAGYQMPEGFRAMVYADGPQVVNPVAIAFDRQGRLYATEIQRRETGVWGVTFSRWWAMEDYTSNTLEDRSAMYDRWAHVVPTAVLTRKADLVARFEDTNGDCRADKSIIFADGFNDRLNGNAAGVLALGDDVYLTDVPDLWRLRDADGDGVAEIREKLLSGLGVRVGVHGHDLHGLTQGPDGRIYFSIGDRGFHVKTKEGTTLSAPRRGAAFRCFPDGTGLEIYHHGLRNPQELAFNEWGDLFTVDNNMGGGDNCRVLYLTEQGDSAWHATYQLTRNFREETQRENHPEPPWFSERLWDLPHEGQPLWQNLPIAHLTRGPCGLAYAPGTGLPPEFDDTFFICDFVGSAARSAIHTFKLKQNGANYDMASTNQFLGNLLPTDVTFGPDGSIYLTDWLNGWGGEGERRIVRVWNEQAIKDPIVASTRQWLSADLSSVENGKLADLLGHADQRVRLRAQYEIASRGGQGGSTFWNTATGKGTRLSRIHGIWGLWQMGLRGELPPATVTRMQTLLADPDAEIRAQTAKVLGELQARDAAANLEALLADPDHRVRYFAALALRRVGSEAQVPALVKLLEENAEADRALRHAGVVALSELAKPNQLAELKDHPSMAVRLGALLALRRAEAPEIAAFLKDSDQRIVFEAIRAIHDLEILDAWPALAGMLSKPVFTDPKTPFPVAHRILNAHFRTGGAEDAAALAEAAANASLNPELRLEALDALKHWNQPSHFDRVTWEYRPLNGKRADNLKPLIGREVLAVLNESGEGKEHQARLQTAAELIARYDLASGDALRQIVGRPDLPVSARLALFFKAAETSPGDNALLEKLLGDKEPLIRLEAAAALTPQKDPAALAELKKLLASKTTSVRTAAIAKLPHLAHPFGALWLIQAMHDLKADGDIDPMALDVYAAASQRKENSVQEAVAKFDEQLAAREDGLGSYALALNGGDKAIGENIFRNHAAQCVRCHRINGFGGEAGPDLSHIARELDRKGLVTALLEPSARISPGFASIEFELKTDDLVVGFVQEENEQEVVVRAIDGRIVTVPKREITHRSQPTSAMPSMRGALKPSEVRDLTAYLSSRK